MPQIMELTDFSAPELDVYARLTDTRLRSRAEPEKGIFIAESPKVITIKLLCDGLNITLGEFFNTPEFNSLEQEIR